VADALDLAGLMRRSIAMVMAGGEGQRLHPLTHRRAKPAVRFGGNYRIIDFTLSNCVNSDLRRIHVLTQYASTTLSRHILRGWLPLFTEELGEYLTMLPPQRLAVDRFYAGTADAVYQNVFVLQEERPARVFLLSGDHAYKMDYRRMLAAHEEWGAELTIACVRVGREDARDLGVLEVDEAGRVRRFQEKPPEPCGLPDDPDHCLVNMGVYVWNTETLVARVCEDAKMDTSHDFGRDIIPRLVEAGGAVYAYEFRDTKTGRPAYWRDIGTIDGYWKANMDLAETIPELNLYDREWPIYSYPGQHPPAKTVHAHLGWVRQSLLSQGCIVSGAKVEKSILSPGVYIHRDAEVVESIVMDGAEIGREARLFRVIVDEEVHIPDGAVIGADLQHDRKSFVVSDGGIVVVPQRAILG
jgi:glucose-1-phosphate adenylyltransferase